MQRFEDHAIIPLEWFYETLEKRLVKNKVKLEDLFLCVPAKQEADTIYEIPYKNQLNYISLNLWTLLAKDNKLKVFFVLRTRLSKIVLLHRSKFKYPKISIGSKESFKDLTGRSLAPPPGGGTANEKTKIKETIN